MKVSISKPQMTTNVPYGFRVNGRPIGTLLFAILFLFFNNHTYSQIKNPVNKQKFVPDLLRIFDKIERVREQKKLTDEDVVEMLKAASIPVDEEGRMTLRIKATSLLFEQGGTNFDIRKKNNLSDNQMLFKAIGALEYEIYIAYTHIDFNLATNKEVARVWCPELDGENEN